MLKGIAITVLIDVLLIYKLLKNRLTFFFMTYVLRYKSEIQKYFIGIQFKILKSKHFCCCS